MTDKQEKRVVFEAHDPKKEGDIILEVELVQGKFVWRYKGKVIDTLGERRAVIDRVMFAYIGHRDFLTMLSILEPLHHWCKRHGVGDD